MFLRIMILAAIIAAFTLIAINEMGDKSQLLAVSWSSQHDPKIIFAAVTLAMISLTVLAVAVGAVLFTYIPIFYVRLAAAFVFLIFGLWILFGKEEGASQIEKGSNVFLKAFSITAIAEMGDKTQLGEKFNQELLEKVGGILFLVIGVYMLIELLI